MRSEALRQAVKVAAAAVDRVRPDPHGAVVLIYHRVGGRSGLDVDLPVGQFDEQLAHLRTAHTVLDLDTVVECLERPSPPTCAPMPVAVTFDDGTADIVEHALPALVRHQVPATIYVATDFVERRVAFPNDGAPVSWQGLRDALSTGLVTIGSHTHTHALLDRLPTPAADEELRRSTELLEDRLGIAVRHFAYPKALVGSPSTEAVVRARFRSAALGGNRPNPFGATDLHRLARTAVQTSDGMRWFVHKAAGGMSLEDDLRRRVNRRRYVAATT